MAHTCGCHTTQSAQIFEIAKRAAAWRADQKVEEVGKDPAGITVDALLDRLNTAAGAPA